VKNKLKLWWFRVKMCIWLHTAKCGSSITIDDFVCKMIRVEDDQVTIECEDFTGVKWTHVKRRWLIISGIFLCWVLVGVWCVLATFLAFNAMLPTSTMSGPDPSQVLDFPTVAMYDFWVPRVGLTIFFAPVIFVGIGVFVDSNGGFR